MVQGRGIDASLNDLGRRQAAAFYRMYQDVPFDKVYVSGLKRTKESVAGFLDKGLPFESLSGLDEISWGEHEGQHFDPEMHKRYLYCVEQWLAGNADAAVSGGESPNQVMARQKESMRHILSQEDEETVLICSHGRAMRILVCWMLENPLHKMEEYEHQNLGLYIVKFDGHRFELETANSTEHLVGI